MKIFFALLFYELLLLCLFAPVNLFGQQRATSGSTSQKQFSKNQKDATPAHKGLLNTLHHKGIAFGISEALEGYYNFKGGIHEGSAYASTFDANMSIDLQKFLNLQGGMFYIDLEDHRGDNPTNTLTGDAQVFDKHNADPFFQALEIWYQQKLFNNKLRIKLGKVDANAEFSVIDNGLEFINSSTQVTPTFFVFPTFPDPMPGINLFFSPNDFFYTNLAIYDANQRDHFLDFYGQPSSAQPTPDGKLLISESGLTWKNLPYLKNDGNLKLGLWKHTGTFTKFDGGSQPGAEGIYLIFDQTLWKPTSNQDESRGLRLFLEYAQTGYKVTSINLHYGGGIVWNGPFKEHPDDAGGLSIQNAHLSPEVGLPKKYELNLETFYKFKLTHWFGIKPDMQYIVHPGGQYPNAFVGILALSFKINS